MFESQEADGAFIEVCVVVTDGSLERDATVTLQSADGSAGGEFKHQFIEVSSITLPFESIYSS